MLVLSDQYFTTFQLFSVPFNMINPNSPNNYSFNFRFFNSKTKVGQVLIAVNPYKEVEDLYTNCEIERYKYTNSDYIVPHIYSVGNSYHGNELRCFDNSFYLCLQDTKL